MKYSCSKGIILAVVVLVASVLPAAVLASNLTVGTPQFDEATRAYKEKKYAQSLAQFRQMHEAGLCNDTVHYYMGLCYQSLCQVAFARQQYTIVSQSKNANLRTNAQAALTALDSWELHRLYKGNGNVFSRYGAAPPRPVLPKRPTGVDCGPGG
jgi:hypothetical protein